MEHSDPIWLAVHAAYDPTITSEVSEPERRLMALVDGDTPRNAEEALMQQQIQAIQNRGYIVEIPAM